jgi:hypothetical protein
MVGWALFVENPLGVGTGGFVENMARFYDPDVKFWGRGRSAESAWVAVLAENGVFGIAVLLAYVASFAWTGFQRRSAELFAVGITASATLALRFLSAEFEFLGIWWLAAGCVFLLYKPSVSSQDLHPRVARQPPGPPVFWSRSPAAVPTASTRASHRGTRS